MCGHEVHICSCYKPRAVNNTWPKVTCDSRHVETCGKNKYLFTGVQCPINLASPEKSRTRNTLKSWWHQRYTKRVSRSCSGINIRTDWQLNSCSAMTSWRLWFFYNSKTESLLLSTNFPSRGIHPFSDRSLSRVSRIRLKLSRMSEKCANNPTKVSKIVGKIRQIWLYLSRTKGRFDRIKVGKFPTILLNRVGHLDPGCAPLEYESPGSSRYSSSQFFGFSSTLKVISLCQPNENARERFSLNQSENETVSCWHLFFQNIFAYRSLCLT